MSPEISIISPWYPTPAKPFGGAFVRAQALAVARTLDLDVQVIHLDEWPLPHGRRVQRAVQRSLHDLLPGLNVGSDEAHPSEPAVTRVPVPIAPGSTYAQAARAHETALAAVLGDAGLSAPVVHAHVGLPGGWVATRLASRRSRVFVTEHATFLWRVLSQPDSRALYDEVIERSTAFFCVSHTLRDEVVREFPHHADKVHVVANPVPFETIPQRPAPVSAPRRWLYVGAFLPRKGVRQLLDAFAICQLLHGDLSLTLLGEGPEQDWLEERASQLGLSESVTIMPSVQPDEVFRVYLDHDLLTHASRYETFGMTLIEAIATGMPVLATRCGGPEETLDGIEQLVGELVEVGDGAAELVAGYRRLRERFGELDLLAGRKMLQERFGFRAIAETLQPYYGGRAHAIGD